MITLYLGAYGHGKSTEIIENIKKDFENKTRSFLIVPEQQTLVSERQLTIALPPSAQLYTEATNLTRLANSVFRKTGGLKYNYVTKSAQSLIMYRTICEVRGLLKHYNKIPVGREKSYIGMFLQAIGELKSYSVTVPLLSKALTELEQSASAETELLRAKVQDILTVWSCYDKLLLEKYDDPYDNLLLLEKKLGECGFFKGCNVYIDSFYGFTKSQLDVISRIIGTADNVTFALDCPVDADENTLQYQKIVSTKNKILRLCQKQNKDFEILSFDTDYKHKSEELKYVCDKLWNFSAPSIAPTGDITLATADDEFAECEYVCTRIKELASKGEKYGDIAIIARNSSTYQGILDFCLDKYEIPYYFSIPSKLSSKPVIKMVVSALSALGGMRSEDIITYAKCGYLDISDYDLHAFESYIYKWNIYGKKFKNDDFWYANPDGFVKNPTISQMEELDKIQEVRKIILSMLSILEKPFSLGLSIKDCAVAVFEFLEAHRVRKKLLDEIKNAESDEAQELSQVWGALIDALDSIVEICGDYKADPNTFLTLLNYAMMDTKIGTIPTGEDNVIIADASLVRAKNIRHVFILGANEGVFPAIVNDDSFFSDSDKVALETVNINLTPSSFTDSNDAFLSAKTKERRDDELLFFKNSIAVASHTATITALKKDISGSLKQESVGFNRVQKLLSNVKPVDFSSAETIDKIYTKDMAKELFGSTVGELKIAIGELCDIDIDIVNFKNENDTISENDAKEIFGNTLYLSKSRLESFARCHFDYYCSYILKLRDSERVTFAHNDIGDLVHAIFEHFLILNRDKKQAYTTQEIWDIVTRLTDEYTAKVCGNHAFSNKMKHFFGRLKSTVCVFVSALLEEINAGNFENEYLELTINGDGKDAPLPTEFQIGESCSIVMTGFADRIDVYRADGKAYVKIIDYKTGTHTFDARKLEKGLDMQMLIYLLALCEMKECDFKKALMKQAEEISPAGIVYLTYKINKTDEKYEVDLNSNEAIENEIKATKGKIMRSGMEVDNPVLKSADSTFNLKDGSLSPFEDFSEVFELVKANIKRIGLDLLSGDASAKPLEGETPCDYCKNGAVCRRRVKSARFN